MSFKTKLFAVTTALLMAVTASAAPASDAEYVKQKGTLTVGVTVFAPMDYKDADGKWIGFDADLAKVFAKTLGVKCEFQIIDWDNKVLELNSKNIDAVWNGMTLTDEVMNSMRTTRAYLNNAQVVVLPTSMAKKSKTIEQMKKLSFAVESGSAGAKEAKANGFKVTEVTDQATALLEVSSGNQDAAVMDSLMAAAMVGPGTNYAKLTPTIKLNKEEYGVGFRKGSDLAPALDQLFVKMYKDGSLLKLAKKYGVQEALIDQK